MTKARLRRMMELCHLIGQGEILQREATEYNELYEEFNKWRPWTEGRQASSEDVQHLQDELDEAEEELKAYSKLPDDVGMGSNALPDKVAWLVKRVQMLERQLNG